MVIEKITPEEIEFMQAWFYPPCLASCLFSNFDNLTMFGPTLSEVRQYQLPFMAYDNWVDTEDPSLSVKEKFDLKKGAAECYNYSGRRIGKSLIAVKLDLLLALLYDDGMQEAITSADQIHLQNILDPVGDAINYHPIVKMWKQRTRGAPKYVYLGKNGFQLSGINMNISSAKTAGQQFFSYHLQKLVIEEASLETNVVYEKRKDAISELGVIIRASGMANFTRVTPSGQAYYNPENKIIALPQYVNLLFDEKELKERIKEYGGKDSLGFRIFVEAEPCEDGLSEFDITRINPFIDDNQEIKHFEIKKEDFYYFRNKIVIMQPKNSDRLFLAADVGDGAGGSCIIIMNELGGKYHYLYRISLYNLKDDEQYEILMWLIEKLSINVIAIDCGDALGRSLLRRLETRFPKDNLVRYAGVDKVGVGFKKNEKGDVVVENGQPVFIEEFMSEWSVQWLKTLLYEGRIRLPTDFSFITQINSIISRKVGTRMVYDCINMSNGRKDDHVFDAFKVFAISQWLKKDFNQTPVIRVNSGIGVCSWSTKKEIKSAFEDAVKNRVPIECTHDEFRKVVQPYLIKTMMKADFSGDAETTKYLSDELKRLTNLFLTS